MNLPYFSMLVRWAGLACVALLPLRAVAVWQDATEMAQRYVDVQRCMERAIGKQWRERYRVDLARNRWGAIEPTGESIDAAPQVVRLTDLQCRREHNLAGEPRP